MVKYFRKSSNIKKKASIPNEIMQKIESYANEQGYNIRVISEDNFNVIPKNKNSNIIQINVYYPKKSFSIIFKARVFHKWLL